MGLDEIHNETIEIEREIVDLEPGSPELAAIVARLRRLQGDLERTRGAMGPLVPDASSPKSLEERTADDLASTLANLLRAAAAKQGPGPG
jgi:hypothetical protein